MDHFFLTSQLQKYTQIASSIKIQSAILFIKPCFGSSFQLYADIVAAFRSELPIEEQLGIAVEEFKYVQYDLLKLVLESRTVSNYGNSNALNFAVVFLYFSLLDNRYGGINESDRPLYRFALDKYSEFIKLKSSFNSYDRNLMDDFNNKHLEIIQQLVS